MSLRSCLPDQNGFEGLAGLVTATVTPVGGDPIEDVPWLWMGPETADVPAGMQVRRREQRRVAAVARSIVPTLPLGSLVVAPELLDGEARTWKVDGPEFLDAAHRRVLVVPVEA